MAPTEASPDTPKRWCLGTVPYLNAQPLVYGLEVRKDVQLVTDIPSRLADRLRAGEFDAALVSTVELFRGPALSFWRGPAVVSDGPVQSILLYLNKPLDALRTVALDSSSLSAAAMTRICLTEFLGHTELDWQHCDPATSLDDIQADAVLRIGDAALLTNPGNREVVDMGTLWSEHTSLPFVYAAWLAPVGTPAEPLGEVLEESHRMGTGALREAARDFARLHAMSAQLSVEYLTKHIRFDLGDREREGLKLFGKLAHKLGLVDRAELPEPLD